MRKWLTVVAAALFVLVGGAIFYGLEYIREAPSEDYYAYQTNHEIEEVDFQVILERANSGDVEAQSDLGKRYLYGERGVARNYSKAMKWYKMAADQNSPLAQNMLGRMYHDGEGVEQNYSQALKWYQLAANQGYPGAQVNLGDMYFEGRGVRQDIDKAKELFRRAAAQGDPVAKMFLERLVK